MTASTESFRHDSPASFTRDGKPHAKYVGQFPTPPSDVELILAGDGEYRRLLTNPKETMTMMVLRLQKGRLGQCQNGLRES